MQLLQNFISLLLNEDRAFTYWLRRPRASAIPDVSDEIEQQRRAAFESTKDDVSVDLGRLKHTLASSTSIKQLIAAIEDMGESAIDVALDPTLFAQAVKKGDIDEVRRLLIAGLEKWKDEMLKWSEQNDYDTSSLAGHPMRDVGMGGNMARRSIGK